MLHKWGKDSEQTPGFLGYSYLPKQERKLSGHIHSRWAYSWDLFCCHWSQYGFWHQNLKGIFKKKTVTEQQQDLN